MDLTEALIDRLSEMPDADDLHIGEVIPEAERYPFIWLMRSAENPQDDLCAVQTVESISVDVEVVSDSIAAARYYTSETKKHLRNTPLNNVLFQNDDLTYQYIHGIDVDDHDDEYLPRSVGSEEQVHVGSLNVTIKLGATI